MRWLLGPYKIDDLEAEEVVGCLRPRNISSNGVTQGRIEVRFDEVVLASQRMPQVLEE